MIIPGQIKPLFIEKLTLANAKKNQADKTTFLALEHFDLFLTCFRIIQRTIIREKNDEISLSHFLSIYMNNIPLLLALMRIRGMIPKLVCNVYTCGKADPYIL